MCSYTQYDVQKLCSFERYDTWGRGIQKICEACEQLGAELPEYAVIGDDLTVKFTALDHTKVLDDIVSNNQNKMMTENALAHSYIQADISINQFAELMEFLDEPRTRKELQSFMGYKSRDYFRRAILVPLIEAGIIDLTIPDKPKSSKQRYIRHKVR